jgi:hypothetical protein
MMFETSKKTIIHITKHSLTIDKINDLETKVSNLVINMHKSNVILVVAH